MLYLYDEAIHNNLNFILSDASGASSVGIFSGDSVESVAAMISNDEISFPIICIVRDPGSGSLDSSRTNFSWMHRGVATVIDRETNELYYERRIPVKLSYTLCVYAANQADIDEIIRELIFHYINMYFLYIKLPYEDSKDIAFGVRIPNDMELDSKSGSSQYYESGIVYETDIKLEIDGAFLVNYTPVKLKRIDIYTDVK